MKQTLAAATLSLTTLMATAAGAQDSNPTPSAADECMHNSVQNWLPEVIEYLASKEIKLHIPSAENITLDGSVHFSQEEMLNLISDCEQETDSEITEASDIYTQLNGFTIEF